ncbi:inner-membrane translocator [Vibrio nigripulchritudo ATCC 27043]|uniref:ABC transporter permease n=1 Tax=Vibrio nigripulchritudo TaxID=28173 RepID=UPI00021C0D36|nr:ABC transporter permease [Vibrio nigripulchritudo]EGU61848.1 inner-membrane translocator [Vibrio nigripulchritudo ATCC 27043]
MDKPSSPAFWQKISHSKSLFLVILLAALIIGLSISSDRFLTPANAVAVLHQSSLVLIVAVGMTLLLISGEVDISVGAAMGFASCVVMDVLNATHSLLAGIVAGVLFGVAVGIFNGLVTTRLKVNSLIGTIATMMILQGGVFLYTREAIQNHHQLPAFSSVATGYWLGIPVPVIIAIVAVIIGGVLLSRTRQGRLISAVGANQNAAKLSGISPSKVKITAFIILGALTGIAAVILASLLNAGQPTAGKGFELIVIAAVLLGGTSLFGGSGSILGTVLAVMILKIIDNGIIILGWNQDWQIIIPGVFLILAVYLDIVRRKPSYE